MCSLPGLVVCLLSSFLLAACSAPPAGRDTVPPPMPEVMSFNIRYDTSRDGDNRWQHRRSLVADLLREHDPDIVGVQEALHHQLNDIIFDLDRYTCVGVGRDDGKAAGEYSAILYRSDRFQVLDSGTFWLSDTPEAPGSRSWGNHVVRICTWARFADKPSGDTFYVFNTHLDHENQHSREMSAKLIAKRIAERDHGDDPVTLTGDFNAGEDNPAITLLLADADLDLADTFRVLHPQAPDVGTFNGFRGTSDGAKIDYVFADKSWTVVEAAILHDNTEGRYPSDHFPVTATLRLAGPVQHP